MRRLCSPAHYPSKSFIKIECNFEIMDSKVLWFLMAVFIEILTFLYDTAYNKHIYIKRVIGNFELCIHNIKSVRNIILF